MKGDRILKYMIDPIPIKTILTYISGVQAFAQGTGLLAI